ncbi:MAG: DUF3427 domain-containing protein [Nitrospirota bacterium]|nr:DUF3427 domain-containing protein [Nitrospirota bacterium]
MPLDPGLYEQVINRIVKKNIADITARVREKKLDEGDSHTVLSSYLELFFRHALSLVPEDSRLDRQANLVDRIIDLAADMIAEERLRDYRLDDHRHLLLEVLPLALPELTVSRESGRPLTGLSRNTLFTGSRNEPRLFSELVKEIETAERVELLVSFIRWSGLRLLRDALSDATRRGTRLRIVTTTYTGATEAVCLDWLSSLPNTEVRVSLDDRRTRLHAKAYIFNRNSGFSTAYIGSSNLSGPAMTSGLEWNIKITVQDDPDIFGKCRGSFDSYWNDPEFLSYGQESRERVLSALDPRSSRNSDVFLPLDIRPFPFQKEILDSLDVQRTRLGSFRNLIVSATGTGKTVISALDFKRFLQTNPSATFLFVAHREEILSQSLHLFRTVLGNRNFGECLTGSHSPQSMHSLFMSIHLFHQRELWKFIPPDFYDYIIIDETHHSEAPTYQRLLEHFSPKILLGLTATPERMDGLNILRHFDNRIAAEIRLPEAISRGLLSPFNYFGVSDDSIDYRELRWTHGGYDSRELENVLTGNKVRSRLIIRAIREYFPDISRICGLAFCASIRHATMMACTLSEGGIPAEVLSGETDRTHRQSAQDRLTRGEVRILCVVDIYNEGVDIPSVNTILFLRPTESLTVFLQQLGRGLRPCPGKEALVVLDFIGQSHQKFRYDLKFKALMGGSREGIEREVQEGFPHLPSGCSVTLERVARDYILKNIRESIALRWDSLVPAILEFRKEQGKIPTLPEFLESRQIPLSFVYRKQQGQTKGWTDLLREAGLLPQSIQKDDSSVVRGICRLSHNGAGRYHDFLKSLVSKGMDIIEQVQEDDPFLLMWHWSFWQAPLSKMQCFSLKDSLKKFLESTDRVRELGEVLDHASHKIPWETSPIPLPYLLPLDLHGLYTREEILAGFGEATPEKKRMHREGVLFLKHLRTHLLLVTLNKTEKDYSPSTLYEDYALGDSLFHWQTQSRTTERSPSGQMYIGHREMGHTILLFVREEKKGKDNPIGLSSPFVFLGPVRYVEHRGSAPMSILWKLDYPMPSAFYRTCATLAAGI